jgi:hypothetical protein
LTSPFLFFTLSRLFVLHFFVIRNGARIASAPAMEALTEKRLISLVDAREHAAIVELLGLGKRQLLFQVSNPLLTILEFASFIIGEAGKTLRHENVNLLVKRIQKLNSGGERRYACHTQFLS